MHVGDSKSLPRVSVVVPTHDLADCVGRCLDSLLAQTYDEFEIVCVDDASTDHTHEVLDGYARLDARVRVFALPQSQGPSAARNLGVDMARGKLVSFVDGDDFVSPHYLRTLVDAYELGGEGSFVKAKNVRGPYELVRDTDWRLPGKEEVRVCSAKTALRDLLLERLSVVAWACLAPRELYAKHRFPDGMVFEDHYVVFDHLASSRCVVVVDTPIYAYVTRRVSLSNPVRHDVRFPKGMYAAVQHLLEVSRDWGYEDEVAWAASWRLALVVSYCQDVEDKREVRKYYRPASRYLRASLWRTVLVCRKEDLDNVQLRKIAVAAVSPHLYWFVRTCGRMAVK